MRPGAEQITEMQGRIEVIVTNSIGYLSYPPFEKLKRHIPTQESGEKDALDLQNHLGLMTVLLTGAQNDLPRDIVEWYIGDVAQVRQVNSDYLSDPQWAIQAWEKLEKDSEWRLKAYRRERDLADGLATIEVLKRSIARMERVA